MMVFFIFATLSLNILIFFIVCYKSISDYKKDEDARIAFWVIFVFLVLNLISFGILSYPI